MKRAAVIKDLVHERVAVLLGQPAQEHVAATLVMRDKVPDGPGQVPHRCPQALLPNAIHPPAQRRAQQLVL